MSLTCLVLLWSLLELEYSQNDASPDGTLLTVLAVGSQLVHELPRISVELISMEVGCETCLKRHQGSSVR